MRTPKYSLEDIQVYLKKHKAATIDQIAGALGNPARCTLFRKFKELDYLSSYSHRGKYYTLRSIPRFSAQGLWRFRSVWFSRFGNLMETAAAFVEDSEAGYGAAELKDVLGVKTKHALIQLVRDGRLDREKIQNTYIYFSAKKNIARKQHRARAGLAKASSASILVANPDLAVEEAKATILLFCSILNEKQRRLYAGLESLKLGHGGDAHIAQILEMDPHTVARGRRELEAGPLHEQTVRAKGGGDVRRKKNAGDNSGP